MKKITSLTIGLMIISLTACTITEQDGYYPAGYQGYNYPAYDYKPYRPWSGGSVTNTHGSYLYDSDSYNTSYQNYREKSAPVVPDTYYTGPARAPVSFKDNDKNWVNSQNPYGYTIQVADEEKASKVAGKLHKVPKNNRMAEIRYQKDGKNYYKGVYGTYENKEAAQKAMENLPADIRQGASVQGWQSVQRVQGLEE